MSDSNGPRAYQMKARQDIHKGFEDFDRQLGVLPTGGGKTILFSRLAQDYQPQRTLILAHREELITQAVDKLRTSTGIEAQVEMGEERASLDAPVVVASVQTLMREKRRERWPRDHFGLVVVDEAHHALADSYLNTLGHFHDHAKVLGVTRDAGPWRQEEPRPLLREHRLRGDLARSGQPGMALADQGEDRAAWNGPSRRAHHGGRFQRR